MRRRILLSAAFALLAGLYLFATYRDLARGPHVDEIEHLHTAARMARGDRIYVDFAQHHPPLFHTLLMPLVHHGSSLEAMRGYVTRARLLVAAVVGLAIAFAGLVVWRVAGNGWAVVVFVSLVFAAGAIWRNGVGDIRPDTTAAALWWAGAALILWRSVERRDRMSSMLRGVGVGLIFVAALMMPRWPLMSLVMGVVALIRIGRDWRAIGIASAAALTIAAAGVGAIALFADLRTTYFFTIELSQAMFSALPSAHGGPEPGFLRCPPLVRPLNMLLAGGVTAAAWLRVRHTFAAPSLVPVLFAVVLASLCEIAFFYPYPTIDYRYYVNWLLAASVLLALLPQAAAALLAATSERLRKWAAPITVFCIIFVLAAAFDVVGPRRPSLATYWRSTGWMLERMRPGDTVWLGHRRPIGVADASYYALLGDLLETALRIRDTEKGRRFLPPIADTDLPPCRLERGLDHHLRFLTDPGKPFPASKACFDRLVQRGGVVRTPFRDVWMVPR